MVTLELSGDGRATLRYHGILYDKRSIVSPFLRFSHLWATIKTH